MSRIRLNSNNSLVIIGESPSFKDYDESGVLFGGVTNSSFSVSMQREKVGAVGSKDFQLNSINKHPEIDLTIDYLYDPFMPNENLMGLGIVTGINYKPTGFLEQLLDKSYNFYFYNHPDEGSDAIDYFDSNALQNPNSGEIFSFGNSYLNSYNLSFEIGSIPKVRTSYKCSNMQGDIYTGNIKSPAINLISGNDNGVGRLLVSGTKLSGYDEASERYLDFTKPDIHATSCGLSLALANIQIGGQDLYGADHRVTSMSMTIPINRVDLEGLGSDYIRDRKIKFPLEGTLNIESNVSKYQTGFISGLLANEDRYSFSLVAKNLESDYASILRFPNLQLESFSYSMKENESMTYSSSFSFPINNKKDFNFWTTPFFDSTVYDSNGGVLRSTVADIPSYWSSGDLNAARLRIGTIANSIGTEAFSGCSNITGALRIPDFTENISSSAFKDCAGFKGDLYLHDLLKDVKTETFYNCSGFDGGLYIGESISGIAREAFFNCTGLNGDLTIPRNVLNIGQEAFGNCSNFKKSIKISDSTTTSIGLNAFSGCQFNELIFDDLIDYVDDGGYDYFSDSKLLLTMSPYLSGINDNAFDNYQFTGSLVFPVFLNRIGKSAFNNNSGINGFIFFDEEVSIIDNQAFYECSNITGNLILPNSITGLGSYSFAGCESLGTGLKFSTSLSKLQSGVFSGCAGFSGDLIFPDYIKEIEDAAFFDCSGFDSSIQIIGDKTIATNAFGNNNFKNIIISKVKTINDNQFDAFKTSFASLTLGDDTKTIADNAFDGYSFTGNLNLNNVSLIGDHAFSGCNSFEGDLNITSKITGLGVGVFQNCDGFDGQLSISNSIDVIKEKTFYNCSSLTGSINIEQQITGIGDFAFYNSTGFKNLNFQSGLLGIGKNTFQNCSSLTGKLIIPESVSVIGDNAFNGCSSFDEEIELNCGDLEIGPLAFTGCNFTKVSAGSGVVADTGVNSSFPPSSLTGLTVKSCTLTFDGTNDYQWFRRRLLQTTKPFPYVNIEEGVKNVANASCYRWAITGELKIPDSLVFMGGSGFRDNNIRSLEIGTGLQIISTYGFANNYITGVLEIPPNITGIGNYAFSQSFRSTSNASPTTGIHTLKLNEGLITIEDYAFYATSSLTSRFYLSYMTGDFYLPASVRSIGTSAFKMDYNQDKSPKGKFTFPIENNLESLGTLAFRDGFLKGYDIQNDFHFPKLKTASSSVFGGASLQQKKVFFSKNLQSVGSQAFRFCNLTGDLELNSTGISSISNLAFDSNAFDGKLTVPPSYQYLSRDGQSSRFINNPDSFKNNEFKNLEVPNVIYSVTGRNANTSYFGYGWYGLDLYTKTTSNYAEQSILTFKAPSKVEQINKRSFAGMQFTGKLDLPTSLTGIRSLAFDDCSGFSEISLSRAQFIYGSGDSAIESGAFRNCSNAKTLTTFPAIWEGGLEPQSGSGLIHPLAFTGCDFTNLKVSQGVKNISNNQFDYYLSNSNSSSISFPESVKNINSRSFDNWPLTGGLTFSDNLNKIGNFAFSGCSGLSGLLNIKDGTSIGRNVFHGTSFSEINIEGGRLFTDSSLTEIKSGFYEEFKDINLNLIINNNASGLHEYAFSGYNLTGSINIPDSVTGIGFAAFKGCTGLSGSAKIGCSVQKIENSAFQDSPFSGFLQMSPSTDVGINVFDQSYFTGLVLASCPSSSVQKSSFEFYKTYNFDNQSTLSFKEGVTGIGVSGFYDYNFTGELKLPGTLLYLDDYSFSRCTGFNGGLTLPPNTQRIGKESFYECSGFSGQLRLLSEGLISIGTRAFAGLDNLSGSLAFGFGTTGIGNQAFDGCSQVGPFLALGPSLEVIDNAAFRNCSGISQILSYEDIPSLSKIGDNAFKGCSNITGDIIFANYFELNMSIGASAYENCSKIRNVFLDIDSPDIGANAFLNGPTGNLYVTDEYTGNYGPTFQGLTVLPWRLYPSTDGN